MKKLAYFPYFLANDATKTGHITMPTKRVLIFGVVAGITAIVTTLF